MQRDTELTFGDIHETKEALLSSIEEIERIALVEYSDEAPLQLRFLTPYYSSKTCHDFALTPAHKYQPGEPYVTVSYTWAHSQSTEGLDVPEYRVWDLSQQGSPPRPIRCPPAVFHRAMRFAQARKCPYVWIDQECIDQSDPSDVERHLQIMHRIYRDSAWTAIILSAGLPHATLRDSFVFGVDLIQNLDRCARWTELADANTRERFVRVLMHISCDRWFRRAWTFHEKFSATEPQLLVPVTAANSIEEKYKYLLVGTDLCVGMWKIDFFFQYSLPELSERVENSLNVFIMHKVVRETGDHLSGARMIRIVYFMLSNCDNTITSDRLAIVANTCWMHFKLKSTLLEKPRYSYATCLLVLIMANLYPEAEARAHELRKLIEDWGLMESTIEDWIGELDRGVFASNWGSYLFA